MNTDILVKLEGLGLWSHSVSEASRLIALNMFYSGQLENVKITYDDINFDPKSDDDPRIIALISGEISRIECVLIKSIEAGKLKTEHIQRNFDENIVASDTYINHGAILEWLENRGVEIGDIMSDWERDESSMVSYVCDEIINLKKAKNEGLLRDVIYRRWKGGAIDNGSDIYFSWKNAQARIESLEAENEKLSAGLSGQEIDMADPPLTQRRKRTYLTIIASLCSRAGIQWDERGAAQRIKEATEGLGAPVSDDTIKAILKDIPDALESRMK